MNNSPVNTGAMPPQAPAANSVPHANPRFANDDAASISDFSDASAAVGVTAALLGAWQAALDLRQPAAAAGALAPSPSATEAALRAVRDAHTDALAPTLALQPVAPALLQAEFRTAPGEHWQVAVQRDAGTANLGVSVSAAFVPPAWGAAQLPRLGTRLRQQGHAADRLGWRPEGREQEDNE